MLKGLLELDLLFKCCCLVIFSYSGLVVLIEVSVYYILLSLILYFLVLYVSLSAPNEDLANSVLGSDPRKVLRESNEAIGNVSLFCIAHRAAGFDSEENSLEALKLCAKNGCKFIHVDVRVTSDNVGVICNSDSLLLSRTDNSISLEKSIEECDFQEICNESNSHRQHIPGLEEVLALCQNLEMKVMMNFLHSSYYKSFDSVTHFICQLYEQHPNLYKQCVISSTNPILLYKIRKANLSIITSFYWTCYSDSCKTSISWLKKCHMNGAIQRSILELVDSCTWWLLCNFIYRIIGNSVVILPKQFITPNLVERWERRNVRCVAAIVNLSSEKSYYSSALGIAYLTDTLINNPKVKTACVNS